MLDLDAVVRATVTSTLSLNLTSVILIDHNEAQSSTSSNPISLAGSNPSTTATGQVSTSTSTSTTCISCGDIGKVVKLKAMGYNLSDYEKDYLLKNPFVPCSDYKFPVRSISGISRLFQYNWLSKYNGLVFSESENGGFCKFCMLFGEQPGLFYCCLMKLCAR